MSYIPDRALHGARARAKRHLIGPNFRPANSDHRVSRELRDRRLQLPKHPEFQIPDPQSWKEDPFQDRNWLFNYHSLRWVDPLRRQFESVGATSFRRTHESFLQSWLDVHGNPASMAEYPAAWHDMATAYRTGIISAAIASFGAKDWLMEALNTHGAVLADAEFGPKRGNHAAHVRTALLIAGDVLCNEAWMAYAETKLAEVIAWNVDEAGVDREGSMAYQFNNHVWFADSARHLEAAKRTVPSAFAGIAKMPEFIAYGTPPSRFPTAFGDSDRKIINPLPDPSVTYVHTNGKEGERPSDLYRNYEAGYVFGRTTWDLPANPAQLFYSIKHGAEVGAHGHHDGGSITLTAGETQLLHESGRYKYQQHPMTSYLKSNFAHNSVVFHGDPYDPKAPTTFITGGGAPSHDWTIVQRTEKAGSFWQRGVYHSRALRALVVLDRAEAVAPGGASVLWHVGERAHIDGSSVTVPEVDGLSFHILTAHEGEPAPRIRRGEDAPLFGWRSKQYGTADPAPVVDVPVPDGTEAVVTVLAPSGHGLPPVEMTNSWDDGGVWVSIARGSDTEHLRFDFRGMPVMELSMHDHD